MTIDEQQLIAMLSDPSTQRKAFELVVRQYSEQLYWQVRRIVLTHEDANDVMQNVMLKAWTNLNTFRKDSKLSTWLYRVSADDASGIANTLLADDYFDGDETEAQLQEAIAKLPDVQRTVFNLRYYEEMKYSEISEILNTTEGALKASYHIAVKKIADFFHERD